MIKYYLVVVLTDSLMDIGFKYYLVVFLTVFLISIGILLLKNPFFLFANSTAHLLNSMLETNKDESLKQKKLVHSLGDLLPKFGLLLLFIALTLGVSIIPVVVYLEYNPQKSVQDLDMRSVYFFISVILGSVALFVVPLANRSKDKDYSGWSILLHRMILENYNISNALFRLEKKLYKKKTAVPDKDFVIVTGLARGGTTALTNLLFGSKRFHSLSYDNMPFLLAVNLWRKLYRPRKDKLKQRAHGDNLMFGYRTIEALEEYFFKVFLNDSYISNESLDEHELDERVYSEYRNYQKLICPKNQDSNYLAKNNNLILRYKSLRSFNPDFKIIMVFRHPLSHAYSLMTQHNRFCDMHEADPFSLEYMNWLGHHEFGSNHKMFNLDLMGLGQHYDSYSINYWISVWISYYTHILTLLEDPNLFLIEYSDLCSKPTQLLSTLGGLLHMDLAVEQKEPYSQRELPDLAPEKELFERARSLFEQLKKLKVSIS